jgi:hypothetical protein
MFVNEGLSITMAIRWHNIIIPPSCGKLQAYNATNENEKIAMDRSYSGEGG